MTGTSLRRAAALIAAAFPAFAAGAQSTLHRFDGDAPGDCLGLAVSGAGDVNGDGFGDVIVGTPFSDTRAPNAGSARVFSGFDGSVLYTFDGESAGDSFGAAVCGCGDVNGDGFGDVAVGARLDDDGGPDAGSVTVYSGRNGAVLLSLFGTSPREFFGTAVSGCGDTNNDGYDDILVGAPGNDTNGPDAGMARVYSGFSGGLLYEMFGDNAGDEFGISVAGIGNRNQDSFDDWVVGAWRDDDQGLDSGSVRVFSGFGGVPIHTASGDRGLDHFGYSVGAAGDVDRDGRMDFIVGAIGSDDNGSESGMARVISGRTFQTLHTFLGAAAGDGFGVSVNGAGDVNGDGYDDLIVGAHRADPNGPSSGSVRVLSGFDGATLRTFDGDGSLDNFGIAVDGIGDTNADGFDEVLIGAFWDDNNGLDSGSAYVMDLGFTGSPPRDFVFGRPCRGTFSRLPRIELVGSLKIDTTAKCLLRSALAASPVALMLGDATAPVPLSVIGMNECTLYQLTFATVPMTANIYGSASLDLRLPNAPAMAGLSWDLQWIITDSGAPHALPVSLSDALRIVIGL